MTRNWVAITVVLSLVGLTADAGQMTVEWKDGLKISGDNADIRIGGRLQSDWSIIDEDEDTEALLGNQNGGHEFRRARLFVSGTLYDTILFKAQYDFAGQDTDFKDAYIGVKGGFGKILLGHVKEPFSLEQQTSSKYHTFIERSTGEPFQIGRNVGIKWMKAFSDDRVQAAAGLFKNADDAGDAFDEDDFSVSARLTGVPVFEDDGKRILHFGGSFRYNEPPGRSLRFRARPEMHLTDRYIDSGTIEGVDHETRFGFEAFYLQGPFSIQAEYFRANLDATDAGDPDFNAFYISGSYFITGESRPFKPANGTFSRVRPDENLTGEGGRGAWEIGARYSQADFNTGAIAGGELENISLALNWYPNPNTRFMFNYVRADLNEVGKTNGFLARLQVDW